MTTEEQKTKHLELIQNVISRLAGNSFSLKGWSITLVSAIFALAAKDADERYAVLALLPALCFWGLDAYYLRQERLFRELYDAVNSQAKAGVQAIELYSMNTNVVAKHVDSWAGTLMSYTIFWLHFPIVSAVLIVTVYAARH